MNKIYILVLFGFLQINSFSQNDDLSKLVDESSKTTEKEKVIATFKTTRLINLSTNEQVKKGELDFRIAHRFLDMAGHNGGLENFFGFDGVSDIRFSFDYGISDKWMVGIARSKGGYFQSQVFDLTTRYKILEQEEKGLPFGLSYNGGMTYTTMTSSGLSSSETNFASIAHRVQYYNQILLVRKFSQDFSLVIAPTVVYRNFVSNTEENFNAALGLGLRYKISKRAAIIADYYQVFGPLTENFMPPIGLGFELETGGHVFHAVISNNRGLVESQFLTKNKEDVSLGQIRLGFNISRVFNLIHTK